MYHERACPPLANEFTQSHIAKCIEKLDDTITFSIDTSVDASHAADLQASNTRHCENVASADQSLWSVVCD